MYLFPGWIESWIKGECAGVTCRASFYVLGWDLDERRQWVLLVSAGRGKKRSERDGVCVTCV
jgi:hypothetical protein